MDHDEWQGGMAFVNFTILVCNYIFLVYQIHEEKAMKLYAKSSLQQINESSMLGISSEVEKTTTL